MKLLIVHLPDLGKTVALEYDDNTTMEVECYLLDVPKDVDLRTIPAQPGERHRVALTPLIMANVVLEMTKLIKRVNQDG
jgi:hypothetical protein